MPKTYGPPGLQANGPRARQIRASAPRLLLDRLVEVAQKLRRSVVVALAPRIHRPPRAEQVALTAAPGPPHVEAPPRLDEARLIACRVVVREPALIHPEHEDHVELAALRA